MPDKKLEETLLREAEAAIRHAKLANEIFEKYFPAFSLNTLTVDEVIKNNGFNS